MIVRKCDNLTKNESRLFVKGDYFYSDRFLHSDEMFRKVTNFNSSLPENREFKNGKCIVTDKDDTAYSIDELINLLNYFNRCTCSSKEFVDLMVENQKLKKLLGLIADADSYTKENNVKGIIRRTIKEIDTVAESSAEAWNDYCLLSNFFKEHYKVDCWDNYED